MYVVIYDETLLCAVQLNWDVVVMLAPNTFDFLTRGGSQLLVDVDVDSLLMSMCYTLVQSICCLHKRSDDATLVSCTRTSS